MPGAAVRAAHSPAASTVPRLAREVRSPSDRLRAPLPFVGRDTATTVKSVSTLALAITAHFYYYQYVLLLLYIIFIITINC